MTTVGFFKLQGAGNDFVMFDGRTLPVADLSKLAQRLCDRRFGVGADGLITLNKSDKANVAMRYFNADGSETICGNGMRCAALLAGRIGLIPATATELTLETESGIKTIELLDGGKRSRVDMGAPIFEGTEIPTTKAGEQIHAELDVYGQKVFYTAVSMGNPHCVIFVDDVTTAPVTTLGPKIETHPFFPKRTNVEFVQIIDRGHVKMRVWERGCGETLACGTGNSAVLAAGVREERLNPRIKLEARGGEFEVELNGAGHILLTGPAEIVFEGTVTI